MKISNLKGIGPKKAKLLEKLSISTIEDLLYLFPRDYQDRSRLTPIADLQEGKPAFTGGYVTAIKRYPGRGKQIAAIVLADDTGEMQLMFFNAFYILQNFKKGEFFYVYGVPTYRKGITQMSHPEFSASIKDAGIIPIYPLTAGISQYEMRRYLKQAVEYIEEINDYLPLEIIQDKNVCTLHEALKWIHFPPSFEHVELARQRLIFDELFVLQTGITLMKTDNQNGNIMNAPNCEKEFINALGFELTAAQMRVANEVALDMAGTKAMNRLIQGDVGCGKTVVAQLALYRAVKSGYQGVMMAPTEILAKQHYTDFKRVFEPFGISVGFLSGHLSALEKRKTIDAIADGTYDIVVGTHALFQEGVTFNKLGLVVTDEQHRFGVNQRLKLNSKGNHPDVIVMSATPIPRTLAMVIYGDIDISIIDELPPGRIPIKTKAVTTKSRDKIYQFLEGELDKGKQAYVVAPLISESDAIAAADVESISNELTNRFPDKNIAMLHGAMKQEEKDEIMLDMKNKKIDILVATVVIEVGINIPNATVMIIENSERFGLAQLHQLRGRVGRSNSQAYCILICGDNCTEIGFERAKIMTQSSDGFYIAERDLDLRGPGEVFGTKQHGLPDLHIANLIKNIDILESCKPYVYDILAKDPYLDNHSELKARVKMSYKGVGI